MSAPAPPADSRRAVPMANRGGASGTGAVRIVVVGGGIAGLAAAHHLVEVSAARRIPLELILLESRDRLGGIIATERAGGCIIEGGPDAFLTEKPWALALCQRLGLTDRLIPTREAPRPWLGRPQQAPRRRVPERPWSSRPVRP